MPMPKDDEHGLRETRQENLELDPAAYDSSANHDVDALGLPAATLFQQALEQTRMAITLVDARRDDMPMVYVNRAFVELTGYSRQDSIGHNCRFLQGPATDPQAVERIRETIRTHEVRVIEVLNYRKDGSTFWNALHIGPVFDDEGTLTHFYGSQWDVTDVVEKRNRLKLQAEVAHELQHRTRNLFSVISSIVSLSARNETDADALANKVRARISALSDAHTISISEGRRPGEASDLHDLASTILSPYQAEGEGRINLRGDIVRVPRGAVTPIGLMLHELATNAIKYGALSRATGSVSVSWERQGDRLVLVWTESGGPEVQPPAHSGNGTRIMAGVLRTVGASLQEDWPPTGLTATLDMQLNPEG